MSEPTFLRLKITGTLTNQTDLMIGSGQEIASPSPTYTAICLAEGGKPYIPASSLRGLLLSVCNAQYGKDSQLSKTLFGSAKNNSETEAKKGNSVSDGNMGALRIYDAVCEKELPHGDDTPKRTRNAINPITGTAKHNFLYSHAYVPENSNFQCDIEADNLTETQIKALLGLLGQLNANPLSQLGKGKSRQQGLITWQLQEKNPLLTLDNEDLKKWLTDGKADSKLPWAEQAFDVSEQSTTVKPYQSFILTINPQSPILINDPERKNSAEHAPDLEYYRSPQGQLLIPASSLKGVIRSHCRKILLTLLIDKAGLQPQDDHKTANDTADRLLGKLFGNTEQQSLIWLKDAVAESSQEHKQTFNAVDRFTGGVADGALYTANAATADTLTTQLHIKSQLEDWQKGLLILLLRDAMEGDLAVGWGKAKGYGSITINLSELTTWQSVIEHFSREKLETSLKAFNDQIAHAQPEPKP